MMTPETMPAHLAAPNYAEMTPGELLAYAVGRNHGYRDGAAEAVAEASRQCHEAAVEAVRNHAKVPARDLEADVRDAAARADWWAARRGDPVAERPATWTVPDAPVEPVPAPVWPVDDFQGVSR
ncbi:hypothetical protein ACFFHC_06900 [Kytococcus schroeteri]|uniref:hypothetical protein n=1 Tax=Kytococcus schroeteri TaxID=138300 RepID=UPI0035E729C6